MPKKQANTPVPDERPLHAPAFDVPVPIVPAPDARAPKKRALKKQPSKAVTQPTPPDETSQTADDTDTEEK